MLELTARHADAWNLAWFGLPDERLAGIRAQFRAVCERVGRDPATLQDTVGVTVRYPDLVTQPPAEPASGPALGGTPAGVAAGLAVHAAAGADHLIVALEPCTPASLAQSVESVALYRAGAAATSVR